MCFLYPCDQSVVAGICYNMNSILAPNPILGCELFWDALHQTLPPSLNIGRCFSQIWLLHGFLLLHFLTSLLIECTLHLVATVKFLFPSKVLPWKQVLIRATGCYLYKYVSATPNTRSNNLIITSLYQMFYTFRKLLKKLTKTNLTLN